MVKNGPLNLARMKHRSGNLRRGTEKLHPVWSRMTFQCREGGQILAKSRKSSQNVVFGPHFGSRKAGAKRGTFEAFSRNKMCQNGLFGPK